MVLVSGFYWRWWW